MRKWWQMTALLAWAGMAICFALAIVAIVLENRSRAFTVLGIPAGTFAATVIIPAILVGVVFAHAARQEVVNRRSGQSGQ